MYTMFSDENMSLFQLYYIFYMYIFCDHRNEKMFFAQVLRYVLKDVFCVQILMKLTGIMVWNMFATAAKSTKHWLKWLQRHLRTISYVKLIADPFTAKLRRLEAVRCKIWRLSPTEPHVIKVHLIIWHFISFLNVIVLLVIVYLRTLQLCWKINSSLELINY